MIDILSKNQEHINRFISVSESYCYLIESEEHLNSEQFLKDTLSYLLQLMMYGAYLVYTDIVRPENDSLEKDSLEAERVIYLTEQKLDQNRYYWLMVEPIELEPSEFMCEDLLYDLIEIYREIKRGILLFKRNSMISKNLAIWQLKFGFDNHWGTHATNSIFAIHYFLQKFSSSLVKERINTLKGGLSKS